MMRTTVVIVNYRTADLVISGLQALARERDDLPGLRAIVVDNASPDHSPTVLAERLGAADMADWVTFLPLTLNGGFGWGNNQAIQAAMAGPDAPEAVLLLNPDAVVEPGAVRALTQMMQAYPDVGAVGSQLVNPDGSLAGSSFRFPSIGREFVRGLGISRIGAWLGIAPTLVPFGEEGPVDWLTGACVLLRTAALRQTGLFDTGFFLYFEEVELMYRLHQHGWLARHCPASRVVHVAGASTGVVDGTSREGRAPPDYVFASRKRYFMLTGSPRRVLLAELAWLLGAGLGQVLGRLRPKWRASDVPHERAALLRIGLGAASAAGPVGPAIAGIDEQPGVPPAWMA